MKVCKIFTFDAAHFLPNHPGKCRNLHGHTYKLEVELEGPINPETGMVMDFGDLKQEVGGVLDKLDHHYLNDIWENPTAEQMSIGIKNELLEMGLPVNRIRLWETATSYAEV